uniref:Synaptic vesicular amine transporter n=4 Tax=Cacopsylla melanoneura TaxID=428564 RepID=A0A8D8X8P2_9HEMI
MLLLARSLQGFASACISVSGMCIVAEQYDDEVHRSKVMGVVLGSIALGVLTGYPVGGFLYDFLNKAAPFILIAVLVLLDIGLQLTFMNFKSTTLDESPDSTSVWRTLLSDHLILIILGSIWISSSAMSILEPCLPIWLMAHVKPEKWQLGTVFIPDSVGYLVGTNFFGGIAYRVGRWRVAIAAMLLVGVSCLLVPTANTISGLVGPHLGLGLGIGVLDSALVPLLASVVDSRHSAHYGSIYALQQTAVSLAYSIGPLFGGELVKAMGFSWLMRCVGLINIIYCPALILLSPSLGASKRLGFTESIVRYSATENGGTKHIVSSKESYQRFYDPEDSD